MTRLYSYKLTHDTGFGPNPLGGILTLATCKPAMRRSRNVGDWIAGCTSSTLNDDGVGQERLIYLIHVERKLPIADYFREQAYRYKIPDMTSARAIDRAGDNIYKPNRKNAVAPEYFEQLRNPHHWRGTKSCGGSTFHRDKDISGQNVLIASKFVYFGSNALEIPDALRPEVPTGMAPSGWRTHDAKRAEAFIEFVLAAAAGREIIGMPHGWPEEIGTKQSQGRC